MLDARQRTFSPHRVEVLLDTVTSGSGMGVKHNWSATGRFLDCLVQPMHSSDATALLQAQTRVDYRVEWADDPALDSTIHRLRIVTPTTHAGKVLRITGMVTDADLRGWIFSAICEEKSEDQETAPALLGVLPDGKRKQPGKLRRPEVPREVEGRSGHQTGQGRRKTGRKRQG